MLKSPSVTSDLVLGWCSGFHFSVLIPCSGFPQDIELKSYIGNCQTSFDSCEETENIFSARRKGWLFYSVPQKLFNCLGEQRLCKIYIGSLDTGKIIYALNTNFFI